MKEEVFAVVNVNDELVGKARRSEVHGNPQLIHRVAHVLVFNSKGQLFLQKRSHLKDVQPGKWDTSVGGHVDYGESYDAAATREVFEELGFRPDGLEFLYKYLHSNDFESEYVATYYCQWDGDIKINPEEIEEGRFWDIGEIRQKQETGIFTGNFLDELGRYEQFVQKN